jgi:hypothetical protein
VSNLSYHKPANSISIDALTNNYYAICMANTSDLNVYTGILNENINFLTPYSTND